MTSELPTVEVHVHIHTSGQADSEERAEILDRLSNMENLMSDTNAALSGLSTAVAGVVTRIDEDVAHLRSLLDEALASDAADAAEIARLRDEANTVVNSLNAATAQLNSIDPDSSFPAPTDGDTPPDEVPTDVPADTGTVEDGSTPPTA